MTKLSIIFPSRRPEQLAKCLDQLTRTIGDYDVEIVVVADTPGVAEAAAPYTDFILSIEPVSAIDAWNLGASLADGDWFFLGADDLHFANGWLDQLWPYLTPEYGVVGADDGADSYARVGWDSHFAASRDFCIKHLGGTLVPPCYRHYYCDVEVARIAQREGLFVHTSALVKHLHWEWHLSPFDDVYAALQPGLASDRQLFGQRFADDFPVTWRPMIHAEAILV